MLCDGSTRSINFLQLQITTGAALPVLRSIAFDKVSHLGVGGHDMIGEPLENGVSEVIMNNKSHSKRVDSRAADKRSSKTRGGSHKG